ncbi:ACP S-malonyltransferase [Robiginitomaculum antarcticum]|uniref:ACP S-malonyltransferase n=1 Tax=Robiginitomaculum antarcticum TaxID=437507 RepID=UPI000375ADF3|nr:ACP S-malonyltransferase [Robiginitomaculum antarcticum]
MSQKQTAVVICPGRGTYGAGELGYLKKHHGDKPAILSAVDTGRADDQIRIADLDSQSTFKADLHLPGDNASALIYGCALGDFQSIDRDRFDIVGVTGNSLGWYMALACAGAVSLDDGARIVNTTGRLMHERATGGQVVFPVVDEDWNASAENIAQVKAALGSGKGEISASIKLGGMMVFAADEAGLNHLMTTLPKMGVFPMRLPYHGAFHSEAMSPIAEAARQVLKPDVFSQPAIPMIDGRGAIYTPGAVYIDALYDYTFGHQITQTYDFTRAIEICAQEFAPDVYIVLGPGTTLGAPVAQSLIGLGWDGLSGKENFKARQNADPIVLSMGLPSQRKFAIKE